jgi:ketosteroid isomerase-like protein
MNASQNAVTALLAKYQDAFNQSATDGVMKLYAPDGVLMLQNNPFQRRCPCRCGSLGL